MSHRERGSPGQCAHEPRMIETTEERHASRRPRATVQQPRLNSRNSVTAAGDPTNLGSRASFRAREETLETPARRVQRDGRKSTARTSFG